MEQISSVRELVRDEVIAIRSGFKNVVQNRRDTANGALLLAFRLDIITRDQWDAAAEWVGAEAVNRDRRGFHCGDKYEQIALEKEARFRELFK